MSLGAKQVEKHYLRNEVKDVVVSAAELTSTGKTYRQAMINGHTGWYRYKEKNGKTLTALKPLKEGFYEKHVKKMLKNGYRSLYRTNNYFETRVFEEWVEKEKLDHNEIQKPGGYADTGFYQLGIDIDLKDEEKVKGLTRDRNVKIAEDRQMLEKAGQFASDWFSEHGLDSEVLKTYFSGNGLYLTIDPSIVYLNCEAEKAFKICEAFNTVIKQIEKEFFEKVPESLKYVQFDALNNRCRQWKTILSVHSSQPFACISLDPKDVRIDLEKAKPPLTNEVLKQTRKWVEPVEPGRRDKYTEKLGELLDSKVIETENGPITPFDKAEEKRAGKTKTEGKVKELNLGIEDLDGLKEVTPPCLTKLIGEKEPLAHARGKGLLAKTLSAVGFRREKALEIFNELTEKAGGPTTNIFSSWYRTDMCLPSCKTINTVGDGYPSLDVGDLDLCNPDKQCEKINNPYQYIKKRTKPESVKVVEKAMESLNYNPNKLGRVYDNKEQTIYYYSVQDTLGHVSSTREALNKLRRDRISSSFNDTKKNNIDKPERKRVIAQAVKIDLQKKGKLLKGENGGRFYYHDPEKKVYRFNEIEPLLHRLYDISGDLQVGKTTESVLKNAIENEGEEVKVRKTWHWDDTGKKLYVYNKDKHYFVLNGEGIEKKPNGTDGIYFLFGTPEDPVKYLPEKERDTDFEIPGKTSKNFPAGNCKVNELLANQTSFTSTTNLTAEEQKLQLLLHIYALPFGDMVPAKPIMLFTGEKGSTKSFTLKKLGRFFMQPDFRCRPLPDEEDFYVAVTKNPLTFFDNVERKPDWLEDALARVATEVTIAKRKLYEDFKEVKRNPKTFLGLTARNISYNRDDVMDRSLLFHAARPEKYLREKKLEKPIREHKNTLWSQYIDNLNQIVKKLRKDGIENLESHHRLADWACLAIRIAEALGYDKHYDIGKIFDKMETERAAYTLRDSELYQTLKKAKVAGTLTHDEWLPASEVEQQLKNADQYFSKKSKTIGRELNTHEKEYGEIFGLKIKDDRNRKAYYFPSPEVKNPETGECEECGLVEGRERVTERGETEILCDECYEEKGYGYSSDSDKGVERLDG